MAAPRKPDVPMRAAALDAFLEAAPETPPMTLTDLDKRLTAAMTAVMNDLRQRAGVDEDRPDTR